MTPKEIIRGMLDLLRVESRWTKGYYAKDAEGYDIEATNPFAVCWCLAGALMKITKHIDLYDIGEIAAMDEAERLLMDATGGIGMTLFNDDHRRTHGDVVCVLEKALAAA